MNKLDQYLKFFDLQREEREEEYKQYANTPMNVLFSVGSAFYGEVTGVDKNGHVVLHFSSDMRPRLNIPMVFCVLKQSYVTELGNDFSNWTLTSLDFRIKEAIHTSFSDILPIYYFKDNNYTMGCERVEYAMSLQISIALSAHRKISFVMLEALPPTELLKNLHEYIQFHPENPDLLLEPKRTYEEWHPMGMKSSENIDDKIIETLSKDDWALLQGPPGTGKSHTIASIIVKIAEQGKNICVTTQSNTSLISLLKKGPIKDFVNRGNVSKTNLSSEEKQILPFLKIADKNLTVAKGELLCSTYYTLSKIINTISEPIYDLIIIEEASQAYLTAIAAFRKLGKKCLIVGDPMQLPPIVTIANQEKYKDIDVDNQANGMMTVIRSIDLPCYRLTASYRLNSLSAQQTSVFYNGQLTSVQEESVQFNLHNSNLQFFPKEGGTLLCQTSGASSILSSGALDIMLSIEDIFRKFYPKKRLAIITPFVKTTTKLQQLFCKEEQSLDITVDTINKIQGLTVDYTIYYIPTRNFRYAFSDNLFNVATSRSCSTTLILIDFPIDMIPVKSMMVRSFLSKCAIVNKSGDVNIDVLKTKTPLPKVVGFLDPSTFERKKKEIVKGKRNIYVIDTNVFIDFPEVLSKIDKQHEIALAAKVLDELDKMKINLSIDKRKKAENAIRSINRLSELRDIHFELSDVGKLPVDFDKRSPDNMILSVALKFKGENPIILTSDNGLQIKAKSLGIKTISLKEFISKPK
jgi:DNA replication ATP-dependent helicase Dna2